MTDPIAEFARLLDVAREPTVDGLDARERLVDLGPLVLDRLRDAEYLADGRLRALTALGRTVDRLQRANEAQDAPDYGHLEGRPTPRRRALRIAYTRADGTHETEQEYRERLDTIRAAMRRENSTECTTY